jgi:hypothetical protein
VQGFDAATGVAAEVLRRHGEQPLTALLVRRRDAEDLRPLRPWIVGCAGLRRHRHQFELVHRPRSLAVGGAQAVGAGVTAADDHHVLVPGADEGVVGDRVALVAPVLQRQVLHREMDAGKFASRHRQVARLSGARGEQDCIVVALQAGHRHVDTDVDAGAEDDAFGRQQLDAALEETLLHLEFGNAVAQQAADAIGLLEHRHGMPGAIQLVGGGEARRAGPDDRDLLPGTRRRWPRCHPALVPRAIDDRRLDRLDGDRVLVDAEHARAFARRRTQLAGELREVVGRVQPVDRRVPAVAVDQIVPVGNQVAERAALVTERNAAVHAARALHLELARRIRQVDLLPVLDALLDGTPRLLLALNLDESGRLAH